MTLYEPQRGKDLLMTLNHLVSTNPHIFKIASLLADIFVFTYPILLIGLFVYGMKQSKKEFQYGSVSIFISVLCSILFTIIIQQFVWKERPESLSGLELILKHVPTISFPSDHATVSIAIAVGTFLVAKQMGWNKILKLSLLLFDISIIMCVARIAVGIHRPTDIIAGWIIGIIGGRIGRKICQYAGISKILNSLLDVFNKNITQKIFPKT